MAVDDADVEARGRCQLHPMRAGSAAFWCGCRWYRWLYNAIVHGPRVSSSTSSRCGRLRGTHLEHHVEPKAAAGPSMSWWKHLEHRFGMPKPPPAVCRARALELL